MGRFDTLGLIFGLIFENFGRDGNNMPLSPRARIYLKTYTTSPVHGFQTDVHTLTPFEYDATTFDAHADRLIDNIKQLKHDARGRFSAASKGNNILHKSVPLR